MYTLLEVPETAVVSAAHAARERSKDQVFGFKQHAEKDRLS